MSLYQVYLKLVLITCFISSLHGMEQPQSAENAISEEDLWSSLSSDVYDGISHDNPSYAQAGETDLSFSHPNNTGDQDCFDPLSSLFYKLPAISDSGNARLSGYIFLKSYLPKQDSQSFAIGISPEELMQGQNISTNKPHAAKRKRIEAPLPAEKVCKISQEKLEQGQEHFLQDLSLPIKHTRQDDLLRYKCTQCDYVAKTTSNLKSHEKFKHSDAKPFKCLNCDHVAQTNADLRKHEKRKHSDAKPFKCSTCTYAGKTTSDLKMHERKKHSDTKPFKCTICDYAAKTASNLKSHETFKHSDEKPFKCPLCQHAAKTRNDLSKHEKRKH